MNIAEAMAILGSVEENQQRCQEAVEYLKERNPKNLVTAFRLSKVEPQAYMNISRAVGSDFPLWLDELQQRNGILENHKESMKSTLTWLDELVKPTDIQPILIKGSSIHRLYNKSQVRHSRDMDIWIEGSSDLWQLTHLLKQSQCIENEAWFTSRRTDKKEPWFINGHVSRSFNGGNIDIDIHSGLYSTMFLQSLRMPPLKEITQRVPEHNSLRELTPEASLLFLIGHAHSHQRLSIRDVNDAYVIINNHKNLDRKWIIQYIKANALELVANDLWSWLSWLYPDVDISGFVTGKLTERKNFMWPISYSYGQVLQQWWRYSNVENTGWGKAIREIMILGWGKLYAHKLAPMLSQERNRIVETVLNKFTSYRHRDVSFSYMVSPEIFNEDQSQYSPSIIDEKTEERLSDLGYEVSFDHDLNGLFVNLEYGQVLLTEGGLFLMSHNLLFGDKLIEESMNFLEENNSVLKKMATIR